MFNLYRNIINLYYLFIFNHGYIVQRVERVPMYVANSDSNIVIDGNVFKTPDDS